MKDRNGCSIRRSDTECRTPQDIQTVQSFPVDGHLRKNLGLPLPRLLGQVGQQEGKTYSYIVTTVKLNQESACFEQHGSGPNYQGDVLSLCTCKHQMRSRLSGEQWEDDVWIAGFTSRTIHADKHWLFFLAKVKSAYDSHCELWNCVDADYRKKKAAHLNFLGDLFQPTRPLPTGESQFLASRYRMPLDHAHRQYPGDNGWKNDINYRHAITSRRAPLLVADPRLTFLWKKPTICFARKKHCRDYQTWASLQQLRDLLREA